MARLLESGRMSLFIILPDPMKALVTLLLLLAPAALAQTWTPQASGTTADLAGVYFLDASTGFAVGDGGLLLATTDGGQTWTAQTLVGGLDLEGIAFNPAQTVGLIATDDGPVLRSTDGGATWTTIATGAGDLRGVDWADDEVVWVAGREGNSAVSTDGGLTWTFRPTGSVERTEGVAAVSATEAWVANREGELRRTTDGGQTWTAHASGTTEDLDDVQMLDGGTGYIAGGDVVLKTTDGGQTWSNVASGEAEGEGLFFLDADTGWVVGDETGLIWFTADGGATWTSQPAGANGAFNRVHFPDADHGWAVGDGGVIAAYTSGATSTEGAATATAFDLGAARPNPFTARTELTLSTAAPQAVRVEVFDVLGRRVARLHEGPLAAGTHRLALDASALPGGLYVVRAVGEAFRATRRVTLAR